MVGLYLGVRQFPWIVSKVLIGFYSGWFLMQYVQRDVAPTDLNTGTMWFIYGLSAMTSTLGLVLAKKWMLIGFKTKA